MAICLPDCKLREGKGKPLVGFTHHCILSAQHVPGTPTPHSPQIKQSSLILSPSLRSTPFLGHYLISGLSFLFVALFISSSWTYMVLTVIAVSLPAPPRTHTCKNRNSIFFPKKSLSSESQVWGYIPSITKERNRGTLSHTSLFGPPLASYWQEICSAPFIVTVGINCFRPLTMTLAPNTFGLKCPFLIKQPWL